jgi:hypothetical protein
MPLSTTTARVKLDGPKLAVETTAARGPVAFQAEGWSVTLILRSRLDRRSSWRCHMTPDGMFQTLKSLCDRVSLERNVFQLQYDQIPLMLIFDERADRMRLISPIAQVEDLQQGMLEQAMEANFHTALDARYATSEGFVWAAFIHPMGDLTEEQLRSAVKQVTRARQTFGDTYASTDLIFGG